MALQYDFIAGLDCSALATLTQAQLLQMINQLAPLSHIGGVIYMNGGGGTAHPDVTNNPRYARYIWMDTYTSPPTPKYYDLTGGTDTYADWVATVVAANSITTVMLQDAVVTSGKMSRVNPAGGNWAARWICRVNAAGTAVEFCNPNAIFAASEVPLSAINDSLAPGAVNSFLRSDGAGNKAFAQVAFNDLTGTLAVNQITPNAADNYFHVTYGGQSVWMASNNTNLFNQNDLALSKLAAGGATNGAMLKYNSGTGVWEPLTFTSTVDPAGALPAFGSYALREIVTGLGATPRFMRMVAENIDTNDANYSVGDEVDVLSIIRRTNRVDSGGDTYTDYDPGITPFCQSGKICAVISTSDVARYIKDHNTPGNIAAINPNYWRLKAYYMV